MRVFCVQLVECLARIEARLKTIEEDRCARKHKAR
jgi:hypothetical protein